MLKLLIRTSLWILLIKTYFQELSPNQINRAKDFLINQMEERNIDMIEQIVKEKFIKNNINVSSELESLKMDIIQDLNELEQKLKPKQEPQNVRPVFKWGQTYRKVFINLKYSHRFDAPGCLDIYNQTLKLISLDKIKENNNNFQSDVDNEEVFTGRVKGKAEGKGFRFNAECQVTDLLFKYILNFDLYEEVTAWSIDKGIKIIGLIYRKCWYLFNYSL